MTEIEYIAHYQTLCALTREMLVHARAAEWDAFMQKECDSIEIMETIQQPLDIESLSVPTKQALIVCIRDILSLQEEINGLAKVWRQEQVTKLNSEAVSAKLLNAYSKI